MVKRIKDNSTSIVFGLFITVIGFLCMWCFNTLADLPKVYSQKTEIVRLEHKIERLEENFQLVYGELKRLK